MYVDAWVGAEVVTFFPMALMLLLAAIVGSVGIFQKLLPL